MTAYRMLNLLTQKVTFLPNFEALVRFCASYNVWHRGVSVSRYPWGHQDKPTNRNARDYRTHNTLLSEQVAMSKNELYRAEPSIFHKEGKYYRTLMFFDDLGRVIDPRHFWTEIADYEPPKTMHQPLWRYSRGNASYTLVFRGNPVPHTAKHKGGRHASSIRTFQERKWSLDEEHAQYSRPCRNAVNLPTSWDGRHRERYKSWKHQGKKKRQWDRQ